MLKRFIKENLPIKFDSVEEQIEFLEIAEKEGLEWSSGKKPTELVPMIEDSEEREACKIRCYKDKTMVYGNYETSITWKDYKIRENYLHIADSCVAPPPAPLIKLNMWEQDDVWVKTNSNPKDTQDCSPNGNERIFIGGRKCGKSRMLNELLYGKGYIQKLTYNIKAIYPNEKKRIVVVKWQDNTTTKVKCSKEDHFDIYVGVALAIAIKKHGTNSQFRKSVDKLIVGEKPAKKPTKHQLETETYKKAFMDYVLSEKKDIPVTDYKKETKNEKESSLYN